MSSRQSASPRHCANCRNHGKEITVRRHKKACPYRACACSKCQLTRIRRSVMARQIQLRRDQGVDADQHNDTASHPGELPSAHVCHQGEPPSSAAVCHQGEPPPAPLHHQGEPPLSAANCHPGEPLSAPVCHQSEPPSNRSNCTDSHLPLPCDDATRIELDAPRDRTHNGTRFPQVSALLQTSADTTVGHVTSANNKSHIWSLADLVTPPVTFAVSMTPTSPTVTSYNLMPFCEPKRSEAGLGRSSGGVPTPAHQSMQQGNESSVMSPIYKQWRPSPGQEVHGLPSHDTQYTETTSLQPSNIIMRPQPQGADNENDEVRPTALRVSALPQNIRPQSPAAADHADIWCTCGNCLQKLPQTDDICCRQMSEILARLTPDIKCITQHSGFIANCLNIDVLETSFYEMSQQNSPIRDDEPSHDIYRHVAYRRLTRWIYKMLGEFSWKIIPACAVRAIRQRFPDPTCS